MSTGARRLLIWITLSSWVMGVVFILNPGDGFNSPAGAYDWALDVLPPWAFGALWIIIALFGSLTLGELLGVHWRFPVFAAYGAVQGVFAISILTLSWEGSEGAVVGALQWFGYVYFVVATLIDRRPYEKRMIDKRGRDVRVTREIKEHLDRGEKE